MSFGSSYGAKKKTVSKTEQEPPPSPHSEVSYHHQTTRSPSSTIPNERKRKRASIFCPAQPDSLFESGYLILVLLDCYEEGHYIIHTNVNLTVVGKQTLVHLRQFLYFWRTCHTNQALKLHFVKKSSYLD